MRKLKKKIIIAIIVIVTLLLAGLVYFFINMMATSSNSELKSVTIENGSIESIGETLKENDLIKSVTTFEVYAFISGKRNLKAGVYELSENMGVKKIVNILEGGSKTNPDEVSITFKEGLNIRQIAKIISDNTNNSYDKVIEMASDEEFINTLIDKYWFLTDRIKDKDIYYSIEGYLFPDTYRFTNKDVLVEDIFTKMLDEMENKLEDYKSEIENSKYSVHEIITLSSITELEVGNKSDRRNVAEVFINRLNSSSFSTLGSDATVYYAVKKDDWSKGLTTKDLSSCNNKYNTNSRCSSNTGIPVGPICNPGIESIKAVLDPEEHDNYFFVNDCDGKLYMSKTITEHNNIISKLTNEGKWCA